MMVIEATAAVLALAAIGYVLAALVFPERF